MKSARGDSNAGGVVLDREQARAIRSALLVGLAALGELERLCDLFELAELRGHGPPRELRPVHPTGAPGTVAEFAAALRDLDAEGSP